MNSLTAVERKKQSKLQHVSNFLWHRLDILGYLCCHQLTDIQNTLHRYIFLHSKNLHLIICDDHTVFKIKNVHVGMANVTHF